MRKLTCVMCAFKVTGIQINYAFQRSINMSHSKMHSKPTIHDYGLMKKLQWLPVEMRFTAHCLICRMNCKVTYNVDYWYGFLG